MLPLSLLKAALGQPVLVELKNGDTYNGRLGGCNMFMNINLRDVICTSKDGDRFWKLPECYIRGNSIKYLRIPDEVAAQAEVEQQQSRGFGDRRGGGGGGRFHQGGRDGGGRGGGRGGGGGRSAGDAAGAGGRGGRGGRGRGAPRGGH